MQIFGKTLKKRKNNIELFQNAFFYVPQKKESIRLREC